LIGGTYCSPGHTRHMTCHILPPHLQGVRCLGSLAYRGMPSNWRWSASYLPAPSPGGIGARIKDNSFWHGAFHTFSPWERAGVRVRTGLRQPGGPSPSPGGRGNGGKSCCNKRFELSLAPMLPRKRGQRKERMPPLILPTAENAMSRRYLQVL